MYLKFTHFRTERIIAKPSLTVEMAPSNGKATSTGKSVLKRLSPATGSAVVARKSSMPAYPARGLKQRVRGDRQRVRRV